MYLSSPVVAITKNLFLSLKENRLNADLSLGIMNCRKIDDKITKIDAFPSEDCNDGIDEEVTG